MAFMTLESGNVPIKMWTVNAVMEAQTDLVDAVHTLKQVLCVKG